MTAARGQSMTKRAIHQWPVQDSIRSGLSLIELLVVIGILGIVTSILLPVLAKSRDVTRAALCGTNVRQMALALKMYSDENQGSIFPLKQILPGQGALWWFGFEAFDGPGQEGERVLDRSRGRLWRYYQMPDSIEICPAFPRQSPHYKPKFTTNWTTYGLPLKLMNPASPTRTDDIAEPSRTLCFADTAQINTFQPPATPTNPMFEQWYYISNFGQTVLYVHQRRASASMFDGHVQLLRPVSGTNELFPEAPIGRPPSSVFLYAR